MTVASPSGGDPAAQIRWASEYIRDRYGRTDPVPVTAAGVPPGDGPGQWTDPDG